MRAMSWRMAAIATIGIAVGATAAAQRAPTQIDIAAMPVGQPPPGFAFDRTGNGAPADWRVVADPSAPAGKVIAQVSNDTTDYRFPLAIYQPIAARNVDVTLRFKPVTGRVDQAGGIAVRVRDAGNYYVARANALEDNVNLYRVVNGRRSEIKGIDTKVATGQWHTLRLRTEGDRLTVVFDDKPVLAAEDTTFADAGRVGLWTKADSVTHFDAITIAPLD